MLRKTLGKLWRMSVAPPGSTSQPAHAGLDEELRKFRSMKLTSPAAAPKLGPAGRADKGPAWRRPEKVTPVQRMHPEEVADALVQYRAMLERGGVFPTGYTDGMVERMRRADKLGARYVLMIGENELETGRAVLRDMERKDQQEIRLDEAVKEIKGRV